MAVNTPSFQNIIVTSDEPWSDIWHTQLHYAYQLSKSYNTWFIDPPGPWKLSNLFDFALKPHKVYENLCVVKYKNILPSALGKLALYVNDKVNEWLLKNKFRELRNTGSLIVWHFDPYRTHYSFRDHRAKHLFHVIDPIAGYNMDKEMARAADSVVVTSPKFVDYYKEINPNVIQVGQGADLEFFKRTYPPGVIQSQVSFDSILLLGTFSDEIDYRFLKIVAEKFPGKLVLIGPDKTRFGSEDFRTLCSMDGVSWLGPMPPDKFHIHLLACRVGIIAYTYENYERNNLRSPLKVISYLACGKSIISNIDCEIPLLAGKAIYNVTSDGEFLDLLQKSYLDQLEFDEKAVNDFLNKINYPQLVRKIIATLHS
jgi:hypothetical protein